MKKKKISNVGYVIGRPFVRIFLFLFMNPKVIHKERVPKKGGAIIASNHLSNCDGSLVGCITVRPIHFLAKKELFDNVFLGPLVRFLGMIAVDRKNKNPEAKALAIDALKDEKLVCVFPEGTRNKTKELLMPFKYGAVSFAYKSGKPLIPIAFSNKPKFFKYNTKIVVGEPYYVKSDDLEHENEILMKKVEDLIREGQKNEKKGKRKA